MKLMLVAAAVGLSVAAGTCQAQTLYNNGPVVDSNGLSILTSPATSYGYNANPTIAMLADNFAVTGTGWRVNSLDFFGYQTQTGTGVYTFTSATWSIVAGTDVNTGATVASGTTLLTNGGLVGYRVLSTDTTSKQRAIFRLNADVTDFNLTAGNYFVTWSLTGTGTSGPFVPPVVGSLGTGNALQALTGSPFTTIVDSGSGGTLDLPFAINGTALASAVPEPATWAMMLPGFGLVGGTMRRRKVTTAVAFG